MEASRISSILLENKGGLYIHTMEKYSKSEDLCFYLTKTTKLMNHLGGMGLLGGEWLSGSQCHRLGLCISLVDGHLGNKEI